MRLRSTFGALRSYLEEHLSRGQIKKYLVSGGCDPERMAALPIDGNMRSPDYLSKSGLLSKGYDTIPSDFSNDDADAVVIGTCEAPSRVQL